MIKLRMSKRDLSLNPNPSHDRLRNFLEEICTEELSIMMTVNHCISKLGQVVKATVHSSTAFFPSTARGFSS